MTSVVVNKDKGVEEVIESAGIARNVSVEAAKAFQPSLYVKQSQLGKVVGDGLFTKTFIPHAGIHLCDYAGTVLSTPDAMKREDQLSLYGKTLHGRQTNQSC